MGDAGYQVRPAWPDTMVYAEGARELRFPCTAGGEPPVVAVPAEPRWRDETPLWAHDRRALIVARLRAARCVLSEVDGTRTCTFSPDGRLRVDSDCIADDRSGLWDTIRVTDLHDGSVIATLHGYGTRATLAFPTPQRVTVDYGDRRRGPRTLTIDAENRRYRFADQGSFEPLATLAKELYEEPAGPFQAVRSDGPLPRIGRVLGALGGAVLAAGGVWQLACGDSLKDRALGALCVVFFGWSSWAWWRD